MFVPESVKEFIQTPSFKALLKYDNFDRIYNILWNNTTDEFHLDVGGLTELFYYCGIDPLKYTDTIPKGFLIGARLYNLEKHPSYIVKSGDGYSITIPNGKKKLEEDCLFMVSGLEEVYIPDTITRIESESMGNCTDLTGVSIGTGVTYIGKSVFDNCKKLTDIIYRGTRRQFRDIQTHNQWYKYSHIKKIECTDGNIDMSLLKH